MAGHAIDNGNITSLFKRRRSSKESGENKLVMHLTEEIGEGSYAKVYRARKLDNEDKRTYAAKVIFTDSAPADFLRRFLPRELDICQKLMHPNVVRTHEVIRTSNKVVMVMEYAPKGDLLSYCRLRGPLGEPKTQKLFKQILDGLHYLHINKIIHRDLKCENILINTMNQCQIADFGFAREMNGVMSKTFCGSAAYAAPELLRGKEYDSFASDIWSLGCILFVMLSHRMPFRDDSIATILKDHRSKLPPSLPQEVDKSTSDVARSVLAKMLKFDSEKRARSDQLISHTWILSAPEDGVLSAIKRKFSK